MPDFLGTSVNGTQWSIIHELLRKIWSAINPNNVPMPPTFPQDVIDDLDANIKIIYFDLLKLYDIVARNELPHFRGFFNTRSQLENTFFINQRDGDYVFVAEIFPPDDFPTIWVFTHENGWQNSRQSAVQGLPGPPGPAPAHEWQNTHLRFMNPDGTWGGLVNLKGDPGIGFTVRGSFDTMQEWIDADITGRPGDGYAVAGRLFVWDSDRGLWFDAGPMSAIQGPPGPAPNHRWQGTSLSFQNPNDTWGVAVDLRGPAGGAPAHEWQQTSIRFMNPNGTWGTFVDLRGPQGGPGIQGPQGVPGPAGQPQWASSLPLMAGIAQAGNENAASRGNHRHPTDTSRAGMYTGTGVNTVNLPIGAVIMVTNYNAPATPRNGTFQVALGVTSNNFYRSVGSGSGTQLSPGTYRNRGVGGWGSGQTVTNLMQRVS